MRHLHRMRLHGMYRERPLHRKRLRKWSWMLPPRRLPLRRLPLRGLRVRSLQRYIQ